jgi:hypothetical protein
MKYLAVFCGASKGYREIHQKQTRAFALEMAKKNLGLVFGGGKIGLMGILADTLLEKSIPVIGVIPYFLRKEEVAHKGLTEMRFTKTMSERKVEMSKLCSAYVALPGGFGTLDEIFEALTLNQLGIESKPVAFLNTEGFFDPLLKQLDHMVKEGFLRETNRNSIIVSSSIEDLLDQIAKFRPIEVKSLIKTTLGNENH